MPTDSPTLRVPYGLSVHGQAEIDAVVAVLRGNTALGVHTIEFEKKIARRFGKRFGVMVNSGSSANLLALELLQLPPGSEVITPLLTFATTVAPIIQKGLVPVFVDVEPGTYLADLDAIERAITRKTRALMIPSLLGNIPNLRRLAALARRHHLYVIEDSCDTLGGTYAGRPTGVYSHISTTSFYGSHVINGAGGGGMICVNRPDWAQRLLVLRGWGRQSSLFGEGRRSERIANRFHTRLGGVPYDAKFIFSEIGYNFLPLELSAAFGLVQLGKLDRFIAARRKIFARWLHFFGSYDRYFSLPRQTPDTATAWLAFPLLITTGAPFSRLDIVTHLERHGIQTRPVFTGNLLKQPAFRRIPHRVLPGGYPNTEAIMRRAFVIGCHHGLAPVQVAHVETTFQTFLARYG